MNPKVLGRQTLLHLFVNVKGHATLLGLFVVCAATVAFAEIVSLTVVPLTAIPAVLYEMIARELDCFGRPQMVDMLDRIQYEEFGS